MTLVVIASCHVVHLVLVLDIRTLSIWCVFFNFLAVRKWTLQTTCSYLWPWLHFQWDCGGHSTGLAVALAWDSSLHFLRPSLHSYWCTTECSSKFPSFKFIIAFLKNGWCLPFFPLCLYMQVYISWLPVHTILAALHLLCWCDNHGKYRTTTCTCKYTHKHTWLPALYFCLSCVFRMVISSYNKTDSV